MYTNFQNALLELLKGRKIRNCNWDKHEYIKLENGELRDYYNRPCELNLSEEGSIRYQLTYQWEVLPTTEELLTAKGKAFDVARYCSTFEESCVNCPVFGQCGEIIKGDYFAEELSSEGFKDDMWFRKNMDKINNVWDKLNKEE